jgi:16S rRNA (cytidine1402-2'-O)-methyltransferase
MKGKIYLIPTLLGDESPINIISGYNIQIIKSLQYFIVEEERTARRFLKKIIPEINIDTLQFFILNEHTPSKDIVHYLEPTSRHSVGLLSEAGLPCIADPGSTIVAMAHKQGIEVVPLAGPSSILLGLMSSGLNGQIFAFNGYLPIKKNERIKMIKFLEKRSATENQTQIFMEAPYRNQQLLEDIINSCNPDTLMCIACDLTLLSQYIETKPIREWKIKMPDIHKRPAIFIIKQN